MRTPITLDCETALITDTDKTPPLTCTASAWGDGLCATVPGYENVALWHVSDGPDIIASAIEDDGLLIVGHNVAFDMCVLAAEWPQLLPSIFAAYEADRITDTMLREKLQHIAVGVYRGYERSDGTWVELHYSLDAIVMRRFGVQLDKDTWRLRYGELRDVPLDQWKPEARQYPKDDAASTLALYQAQDADGAQYLKDEFRQARAAFWMQLMSVQGFRTDPNGVQAFADAVQRRYDDVAADIRAFEFEYTERGKRVVGPMLRADGTRCIAAVKERVVQAYAVNGKPIPRTGKLGVKTDKDTCAESGDEWLEKYAELSSLVKMQSTDIPLLQRGQLHVRWGLTTTGRTSTKPNIQNFPTGFNNPLAVRVRECFAPREGYVFIAADYSGFELRTVSQVCFSVLGWSRLRDALISGLDPHLEIAAKILGCSYEDAKEFKNDNEVQRARQAGKIANFGFPGGLGIAQFVDYARKQYGVKVTEELARQLKEAWLASWPEMAEYHKWIGNQCEVMNPQITFLFSGMVSGGLSFTEAANGLYQALAATAAKNAGFLIAKASYVDASSPMFGCRPVNFPHDEFITEAPEAGAAEAAEEQARLMVEGAKPFLPDVPVVVEPLIMRRWSKNAKPVRDANGRLVPWDLGGGQ